MHLGMTGRLVRRRAGTDTPLRTRATLHLDDGQHVHYVSTRLLGSAAGSAGGRPPGPGTTGRRWAPIPSPTPSRCAPCARRWAGSTRPVKPALMDQGRIAGLGNIQAAEALWLARIDPRTPAGRLDDDALGRLRRGILRTLRDTIAELDGDEVAYLTDGVGRGEPLPGLRPRRRAVPAVPGADPAASPGRPDHVLLPTVPEGLTVGGAPGPPRGAPDDAGRRRIRMPPGSGAPGRGPPRRWTGRR